MLGITLLNNWFQVLSRMDRDGDMVLVSIELNLVLHIPNVKNCLLSTMVTGATNIWDLDFVLG